MLLIFPVIRRLAQRFLMSHIQHSRNRASGTCGGGMPCSCGPGRSAEIVVVGQEDQHRNRGGKSSTHDLGPG
jgi:hypothetical protein